MESRQLFVFSALLACVGLSDGFLLGMKPLSYWGAVMQTPEAVPAQSAADPVKEPFSLFARPADVFHSKWIQAAGHQNKWRFPEGPAAPVSKRPVELKVEQPVPSSRVAVRCGESKIHVEVKQDLLGLGKLVDPEEITLGGCPAAGIDRLAHVLIFESELHDCGSTLEVSQDGLIYTFKLIYNPKIFARSPIIRSQRTEIDVECRYSN
ncbi:PREDICTED: zona pellucida sperm-binding protein 3-like [Cyprinodon variegatus]|uniref:zona pellucida sperm-binding protein 3-like n=1 Tax=Cyprinodon variegatus TaxID=28743 RepID=UPI000742A380|nr:PREDICTED: zona pellucida sperm-binding protein 3-like [Cyprinodon variegatus]